MNARFRVYKDKLLAKGPKKKKKLKSLSLKIRSAQSTNIPRNKRLPKNTKVQNVTFGKAFFPITEIELRDLPGTVTPPRFCVTPDSTIKDSDVQFTSTPDKATISGKPIDVLKMNYKLGAYNKVKCYRISKKSKHVSFKLKGKYKIVPLRLPLKYRERWLKICFLKAKQTGSKAGRKPEIKSIVDFHRNGDLLP